MFTIEQYRAKAAEYTELMKTTNSPDEVCEFHKLEQSFTQLADNEQWVTDHHDQTLHAAKDGEAGEVTLAAEGTLCFSMTGNAGYQPSGDDTSTLRVDAL
jgi:hypothetical protein